MSDLFYCKRNNEVIGTMRFEDLNNYVLLKGSKVLPPTDSLKRDHFYTTYQKYIDKMRIENEVLIKDFSFGAPSPASAVVRGTNSNGYHDWKTEDGIKLHDFLSRDLKTGDFDFFTYYLDYKQNHLDINNDNMMKEIHEEFVNEYSLESLLNLKLEDYALGDNDKTNLCYELEWGKWAKYGSLRGATSGKFGIYKHSDGNWKDKNHNIIEEPIQYFELIKKELVSFLEKCNTNYFDYFDSSKDQTVVGGLGTMKNKFASLLYPEHFIRVTAKNILIKIHKKLGFYKKEMWDWDTELVNHYLVAKLKQNYPELEDENTFTLGSALWYLYANVDTQEEMSVEPKPVVIEKDESELIRKQLFIPSEQINEIIRMIGYKKNIIITGPPGVGKTFSAKKLVKLLGGQNNHVEMVQFHQSYSYEDFVQGYRPNVNGTFEIKDGIFVQLCKSAINNAGEDYYLIIDEINRGNLSKIFGELLLLIEKDKRGSSNAINLSYSSDLDEKFYIPENVYILGTMNTADRSLSMVDYALRRRFAFFDFRPAFGSKKMQDFLMDEGFSTDQINKLTTRLININSLIRSNLGEGFEIGHSYFCNSDFDDFNDWFNGIVKYEINPMLKEYWFDDEEKYNQAISMLRL